MCSWWTTTPQTGTTEILAEMASEDGRLVHIVPERTDLGIGGCWNAAIYDRRCGRFAVQLDSDDVYSGDDVLARIVEEFGRQDCAMVVGTYLMTDFSLAPLPPGVIDHREWTDANGGEQCVEDKRSRCSESFPYRHIEEIRIPGHELR